jgi:hypothetical protein
MHIQDTLEIIWSNLIILFVAWYLAIIDQLFLGIYVMEMVLKIWVFRISYFKTGWNIFGTGICPSSLPLQMR